MAVEDVVIPDIFGPSAGNAEAPEVTGVDAVIIPPIFGPPGDMPSPSGALDAPPSMDGLSFPGGLGDPLSLPSLGPPEIPGLEVSGGRVVSLPDVFPDTVTESMQAQAGERTLEQLNTLMFRTSRRYNRERDVEKRVQILGEFIREWDPDVADQIGFTKEGYVEPKGFWKVLDFIDKLFDRPIRVGGATLWDMQEEKAARILQGKDPSLGLSESLDILKRNWKEDKGTLEDGADAFKNWTLWFSQPLLDNQRSAEETLEAGAAYDIGEQEFADDIISSWYGTKGFVTGASQEEIDKSISESIEAGSVGGHMLIGLGGLMSFSSLNVLGGFGGATKGASGSARRLATAGVTPSGLGKLALRDYEEELLPIAREAFITSIEKSAQPYIAKATKEATEASLASAGQTSDAVAELRAISSQLGSAEDDIASLRSSFAGAKTREAEALSAGAKVSDEVADLVVNEERLLDAAQGEYGVLLDKFEEALDGTRAVEGIPGRALMGGVAGQASMVAYRHTNDAIDLAHRNSTSLRGIASVRELSIARRWSMLPDVSVGHAAVDSHWVDAMRAADKEDGVLVHLGLITEDNVVKGANPTILSPEAAYVYEKARKGVYGLEAKVAAQRPQYGTLQKVMGSKEFAKASREATRELRLIAAEGSYIGRAGVALTDKAIKAMGKKPTRAVLDSDLIKNLEPTGFAIAHYIAGKFPEAEPFRRALAGLASLSVRPATYARKNKLTGRWEPIPREQTIHPGVHYRATRRERRRLTDSANLRSRWPAIKAQMEAMSDNPEYLNMARSAVEMGWADPATIDSIVRATAIRRVRDLLNNITESATQRVDLKEGRLVVLSEKDMTEAREAIRLLQEEGGEIFTGPGDLESIVNAIAEHGAIVEEGGGVIPEGLRSLIKEWNIELKAETKDVRLARLADARLRVEAIAATMAVQSGERAVLAGERAIGEINERFAQELHQVSEQLSQISQELGSTVGVTEKTNALGRALNEATEAISGISEEALKKSRSASSAAYKQTLEDFKKLVREDVLTDSLSDIEIKQMHTASVQAAWEGGKEIPVSSLFEAGWWLKTSRPMDWLKDIPVGTRKLLDKLGAAKLKNIKAGTVYNTAIEMGVEEAAIATYRHKMVLAQEEFDSVLSAAEATTGRIKKVKAADETLLYPHGSDERILLEALESVWKNRMASIETQIANDAAAIRESAKETVDVMFRGLVASNVGVPGGLTKDQAKRIDEAITQLKESLFGKDREIDLPARADDSIDVGIRRALREVNAIPDPIKRAAALKEKLAVLKDDLAKVGDEFRDSDLGRVAEELTGKRRSKKAVLPLKPKQEAAVDKAIKEFVDWIEEFDSDLRHPADVTRGLESLVSSSYNQLEAAGKLFEVRLLAVRDAWEARFLDDISEADKRIVAAMVSNPDFHVFLTFDTPLGTVVGGAEKFLNAARQKLKDAEESRARRFDEGRDIKDADALISKYRTQVEVLSNAEEFQKVLGIARLMKGFFDDWLEAQKALGLIDEAFDTGMFFNRVNVGGYFPHMLSAVASRKLEAMRGQGVLGSAMRSYFLKERKVAGTIDEINEFRRADLAAHIVHHKAMNGLLDDEAALAARGGIANLKSFLGDAFDVEVRKVTADNTLAEIDILFETDPFVIMEHYHMKASSAVADAAFINDILEMFPMGREIAKLPTAEARAEAAEAAGFVRLGEVEYLQSVLKMKLPKELRGLAPKIKDDLVKGVPVAEIVAALKLDMGIDVPKEVILAIRSAAENPTYIPVQVKEYLNWRNGTDFKAAKSQLGEAWDGVHAWMKAQTTIVALAHVGRNVIGNIISSVQELGWAACNPITQLQAARIWGSWGDDALDAIVKIGDYELTVKEWRKIFTEEGFFEAPLSTDFMQESVGIGAREIPTNQQLAKRLAGTGAGAAIGLALGGAPGFFAGGALGLVAGGKWSGVKATRGGSAYEKFVAKATEEASNVRAGAISEKGSTLSGIGAGAIVGSVGGPVGSIAGGVIGALTMPDYISMMGGLNRAAESQARLSMAIAAIKKGATFDEALVRVNKALRDYSDLTPLEKNVFRRMFFFWTWDAGNVKYQVDWLRRNPRAARTMSAFLHGLYQGQFTEEQIAALPEHYRFRVVMRSGAAKVMAISGLPHEPMLEILTRGKRDMAFQGIRSRLHPGILTFLEMVLGGGRSTYYGKHYTELTNINQLKNTPPLFKWMFGYTEKPNYWVPVYKNGVKTGVTRAVRRSDKPLMFYLAQKLPGWRVMNQYMTISADTFNSYALETALTPDDMKLARAKSWEKAVMFGLGWKQTIIDFDQQAYFMQARLEREMLDAIEASYPLAVKQITKLGKEISARPTLEEDLTEEE